MTDAAELAKHYAAEITMPATRAEGFANQVQMILNYIAEGADREAVLQAADLLDRLTGFEGGEVFKEDGAVAGTTVSISDRDAAVRAATASAYQRGHADGVDETQRKLQDLLGAA